jgi:hypothetical protein
MTKPDYRTPPPPVPRKPLAQQAAQVAFWAPIVATALALTTGSIRQSNPAVAAFIGYLNIALTGGSLVLGVVALVGMRRHGPRGILVRSIVGILLSSLLLVSVAYLALMPRPADLFVQRLVGTWQTTLSAPGSPDVQNQIVLSADRHASARFTVEKKTLTVTGQWKVGWDGATKTAHLAITWDPSTDPKFGKGVIWAIERLEPDKLILQGKQGANATHETYVRIGN